MDSLSDTSFVVYSPDERTYGYVYNILLPFNATQTLNLAEVSQRYTSGTADYYAARNADEGILKAVRGTDQREYWFNGDTDYSYVAEGEYYKNAANAGREKNYLFFEDSYVTSDEGIARYAGKYPYSGAVTENEDGTYSLTPDKLDIDQFITEMNAYINWYVNYSLGNETDETYTSGGYFNKSDSGMTWDASDGSDFSGSFDGNDSGFSDFFESLFGSRRGTSGRSTHGFKGQDYNAELHLSLRDAATTHKQILDVNGKKIRITVPAGIADGQTIRLAGQGGAGINGGPAGDLYITFVISDDPVYKREGDNLYMNVPVDLYTAVLGGDITVDTLNGKVKLKIKPETQNGTRVRLKGKGFPVYKEEGKFGDLLITYEVKLPTHLTEKQKELFRELQNA